MSAAAATHNHAHNQSFGPGKRDTNRTQSFKERGRRRDSHERDSGSPRRDSASNNLAAATSLITTSFVKKRTVTRSKTAVGLVGSSNSVLSLKSQSSLKRIDSFYGNVPKAELHKPLPQPQPDLQSLNVTTIGKRRWQIDPRVSKYMPFWDLTTSLAILFTAFVTPYEVALLPMATSPTETLFLINRFLDVIFIIDMYVQFVLIYSVGSNAEGLRWVEEPRIIACTYLRGWFALDLTSIAVSAVDLVGLQGGGTCTAHGARPRRAP
jgi:hypothetical protein